jgi:hypothetical protein
MRERMKKIIAEERKVLRYNLLVLLVQIALVIIAIIFTGEYMLSLYDLIILVWNGGAYTDMLKDAGDVAVMVWSAPVCCAVWYAYYISMCLGRSYK